MCINAQTYFQCHDKVRSGVEGQLAPAQVDCQLYLPVMELVAEVPGA